MSRSRGSSDDPAAAANPNRALVRRPKPPASACARRRARTRGRHRARTASSIARACAGAGRRRLPGLAVTHRWTVRWDMPSTAATLFVEPFSSPSAISPKASAFLHLPTMTKIPHRPPTARFSTSHRSLHESSTPGTAPPGVRYAGRQRTRCRATGGGRLRGVGHCSGRKLRSRRGPSNHLATSSSGSKSHPRSRVEVTPQRGHLARHSGQNRKTQLMSVVAAMLSEIAPRTGVVRDRQVRSRPESPPRLPCAAGAWRRSGYGRNPPDPGAQGLPACLFRKRRSELRTHDAA